MIRSKPDYRNPLDIQELALLRGKVLRLCSVLQLLEEENDDMKNFLKDNGYYSIYQRKKLEKK